MDLDLIRSLAVPGTTKIVLLSADGLGGFPDPATGLSELETARIPHLDALARRGACGLLRHVAPGITPGSGPGHLGLFGYEPLRYPVGRGVLEALGIDFDLRAGDVAARGNFCTLDAAGRITDRRAGRISDRAVHRAGGSPAPDPHPGSRAPRRARQGAPLRAGAARAGPVRPPVRDRPPGRRPAAPARPRAQRPEAQGTAEIVNRFVARGPAAPGRRGAGEHGAPPRLRPATGAPALPRGLRPPRRGDRRVPDVPGPRPPGGHGRAQDRQHVHGRGAARSRTTGTPTTSCSCTTRTRTRPGRTATSRARWRRSSAWTPRCPAIEALHPDVLVVSGDHATPAVLRGPFLAPGAGRAGRSVRTCPMPWSASPSGPAGREASGPYRPTTSCRSSWPTPCA